MFKLKIFTLLLLTAGFWSCDKKNSAGTEILTLEDLLVKDNEISGWSLAGNFWQASSTTDLTVYIDGDAELYQRHGFIEAVNQEYQGTIEESSKSITIRIFDQGSGTNAGTLFEEVSREASNPETWDEAGDEAIIVRYDLSRQIIFRKDKYFVYLDISTSLESALDILKSFARNVDRKIG
jgi:hypothetical protein